MTKDDFVKSIINSKTSNEVDELFTEIQVTRLSEADKNELFGMIHIMKRTVVIMEEIENYISPLPSDNYTRIRIEKAIEAFKKGTPL